MKKNLLFAGLLLAVAPISAQEEQLVRSSQDAKVIFEQDFEQEWETWTTTPVDSITQVVYYNTPYNPSKYDSGNDGNNLSGTKIWDDSDTTHDWTIYGTKDTLLVLYNGALVADVEQDAKAFAADSYTIVNDEGSTERQDQLDNYAVDGGKYYFRYISMDTVAAAGSSSYSSKKAARYRRNLFVRGLDIEDETSYRLTVYVKTRKLRDDVTPTFYADVMRGYFASEKPFTLGFLGSDNKYKPFEYTKNDFKDNEWEKITFMTYYLNDSIAQNEVFIDGYWWASEWKWRNPKGRESDTLCYIMQPDKFFVRLGFSSDSTEFSVDNLSLTKSWIGGVEYYNDMIRVDFGYETCLDSLAEAAFNKNYIAAVEVPGKYFTAWGLTKWGDWELVPIRTAEYHGDGYMYMWTEPWNEGGYSVDRDFGEYDSVLVSFTNPVDRPDLRLYYNGALFPKSLDTEWMANGKMVPDFKNEIAYLNPNIGKGVYSMAKLPPVCQRGITAEAGSFQLDGNINEFTFKFSSKIKYDDKGEASKLALLHVVNAAGTEVWTVKSANDTAATFVRPASCKTPLSGDYEFRVLQLQNNYGKGEDRTFEFSFGPAPETKGLVSFVSFEKNKTSKAASKTMDINGFTMEYSYQRINEFAAGGLYTKGLTFGVSAQLGTGANGSSQYPTLYYAFNITEAGNYDFNIKYVANHGSGGLDVAVLDAAGNKLSNVETIAQNLKYNEGAKIENVDVAEFTVEGLPVGSYKLKIAQPKASDGWYLPQFGMNGNSDCYTVFAIGIVKSGNSIPATLSISYPVMSAFDNAQTGLNTIIATAEKDKDQYTGSVYDAAVATKGKYADFNKTTKVTAPSIWNAATTDMTLATKNMEARMAVVDAMWDQYNASMALIAKYDSLTDADGVNYKAMDSYKALKASCEEYEDYICKDKSDADIKAVQTIFEDGQKALDAQKAIVDDYQAALAAAKAAVEDKDALTELDSYIELDKVYSQYKTFDCTASAQDDTKAATSALLLATSNYKTTTGAAAVNSIWYQALADLAQTMGADFGDSATVYADRVSTAKFDDGLAKAYKKAITAALYKKIADGENVDSIPLSAFIKNNELYATPKIVERMDKQMPANVGDLKAADAGGANIQHTRHQWNDSGNQPIWIMIPENDYTDLLNGWTVRAIDTNSGNRMVTVSAEGGYDNFKNGETFWNGELAMDWNGKATLSQTIEDIPVGMFSIGAEFLVNTNNTTAVEVTVDGGEPELVNVPGDKDNKFTGTAGVDSVIIANGTADLKLTLASGDGWSRADNFYLVFRGKKAGFNYSQAATDAKNELNQLITFVDPAQADAQVEIYSLDGKKIQSAKAGQINIRVTKKANGERIVEKVLVK